MNDKTYDAMMNDREYKKGLSIAFFNANNNATEIAKFEIQNNPQLNLTERIIYWRDWLLSEHATYYAQVVMNVGKPYSIKDTIAELQTAKNYGELMDIWLSISEDQRQDAEIRSYADTRKLELKKSKAPMVAPVVKPVVKKVAKKVVKPVVKKVAKKVVRNTTQRNGISKEQADFVLQKHDKENSVKIILVEKK
jgi:hypothetical protein